MRRMLVVGPVVLILAACSHSDRDAEAKQQRAREQRFDATLQRFTIQHNAVRFDTRDSGSIFHKLTIDAQDSIAAAPAQLYWSISDQFDIYRDASGPHLLFRAISDHWVLLSCTDTQVAEIRTQRRPDWTFVSFALAYTLLSASPLHVELRGSSSSTGDTASVAVTADEITGRFYTGQLSDFVLLDDGQPIETH